jgi:hypothetical protein
MSERKAGSSLRTTRLFYTAGESGLRQRGRRFAPVFNVRAEARTCLRFNVWAEARTCLRFNVWAEARTCLRTVPSFLATDAVET